MQIYYAISDWWSTPCYYVHRAALSLLLVDCSSTIRCAYHSLDLPTSFPSLFLSLPPDFPPHFYIGSCLDWFGWF